MIHRFLPLAVALSLGLALFGSAREDASADKIRQLIGQLGSESFADRQKATQALDAIGVPALEALRQAAKSDDVEVKRRAGELLKKIEKRAESEKILTPRRVHLIYKNVPLSQALADFRKKSGYKIHLIDPQEALKERSITLDTGKVSFWRALALFCDKANLTEATVQDLLQAPQRGRPGGAPGAAPMPMPMPMGMAGIILLKDGKPEQLPSDDAHAVRVRAVSKSERFGQPAEGEFLLALEVSPEPRLQWQALQSIHIDKALDDQGQQLKQITPQVPAVGGGAFPPNFRVGAPARIMRPGMRIGFGSDVRFPAIVHLKKGEKQAKALQELKGVLSASVLAEAKRMIVAEDLAQATGKTFKGKDGGALKILDVTLNEGKKMTVRLELEQPPVDEVMPEMPAIAAIGMGARPMPLPVIPGKARPKGAGRPGAAPLDPVLARQGGGADFTGPINGLIFEDGKGNRLPLQMGAQQFGVVGGGRIVTHTYTLICQPGKDQGEAVRIVFLGRKHASVEVPFRLKNVPLP